jgi:hypothetical protein
METEVYSSQLPQSTTHDAALSEQGWVLKWGETDRTVFEVVCRTENALQVAQLKALLSDGHRKAVGQFAS